MKKIGHEVLFLHTCPGNPRNGEGTFIRLKDGRILYAYTEYYGSHRDDHSIARISAVFSSDEGESWTAPRILFEKDVKAENYMSPSLVRLPDGGLGIIYLRKEKMPDNGVTCMPTFSRSDDEGETWTSWQTCQIPLGYYCGINDGALVLRSGRILMPLSYHGIRYDAFGTCTLDLTKKGGSDIRFACSDDNGATWALLPAVIASPYPDNDAGFAEPGVYEHEDGSLWCWLRTGYGFQYHSHSTDGGMNWHAAEPNLCFSSPPAPMRVKKLGKYVVAVFNPIGFNCVSDAVDPWGNPKRTPLVCAVSRDDGHSFADRGLRGGSLRKFADDCRLIEDDRADSYCYPALQEVADGFLAAYYHSDGTPYFLNSGKITKVRFDELD
ncbi:MAG: exo-alpha-sialidase [Ruminococcaceae bacterium]|nr:exo-alpha-sialidase [Oscillospiraceae bacterium]